MEYISIEPFLNIKQISIVAIYYIVYYPTYKVFTIILLKLNNNSINISLATTIDLKKFI